MRHFKRIDAIECTSPGADLLTRHLVRRIRVNEKRYQVGLGIGQRQAAGRRGSETSQRTGLEMWLGTMRLSAKQQQNGRVAQVK